MGTGRKPLIISVLRETHLTSVPAFSCKRGPAVGGRPESLHGACSRHGADRVESPCGVAVGGAARSSRFAAEWRPQQQEACRQCDPQLQTCA